MSDPRKARTRAQLVRAARDVIERGTMDVSIQEITDSAGVGFGSFYNHFADKSDLFEQAVGEILEEYAEDLDLLQATVSDPAERFSIGLRFSARLADVAPAVTRVFVAGGMRFLLQDRGLAPRARHDIERGIATGRFTVSNPNLALGAAAGSLFAYLHLRLQDPPAVAAAEAPELAERLLMAFGVPSRSAHRISHAPLPG
jgi:AcrR family transcriptional regulator